MVRQEHQKHVPGGTGGTLRLCLGLVALVIALGALIVALIAYMRPLDDNGRKETKEFKEKLGLMEEEEEGHGGSPGSYRSSPRNYVAGQSGNGFDNNMWLFAVKPESPPYVFINDMNKLDGFYINVITKVCELAERRCNFTVMPDEFCWKEASGEAMPGEGLLNGYFDGCVGWVSTPRRMLSLSFSPPLVGAALAYLYVSPNNLSRFDSTSLEDTKVGVVEGDYRGIECLDSQDGRITGVPLPQEDLLQLPSHRVAVNALLKGDIDVVFGDFSSYKTLSKAGVGVQCHVSGPAVMFRKDSQLPEWFNPALSHFMSTEEFRDLCDNSGRNYGGDYAECVFTQEEPAE